jgi:anti-sigma factor RsiW
MRLLAYARMLRFYREHRWTHDHLSEYLDDELSAAERRRVEEHTSLCPHCRRVLASLRRTLVGLRMLGSRPAAPGVSDAIIDRLRREE